MTSITKKLLLVAGIPSMLLGCILLMLVGVVRPVCADSPSPITGTYAGTVAITGTVEVQPLSLSLVLTGTETTPNAGTVTGYVDAGQALAFPVLAEIGGEKRGPAVAGAWSGTAFALQSDVFTDMAGVNRQFVLHSGVISDTGVALTGIYSETLRGLLPEPVVLTGTVVLVRPPHLPPAYQPVELQVSATPRLLRPSTMVTVSARLLDFYSHPIAQTAVSFAATSGSLALETGVTDYEGQALTFYTAGTASGPITITASAAGLTGTVALSIEPERVATLNVQAARSVVPVGTGRTAVTVTVQSQFGRPMPGQQVSFSAQLGSVEPSVGTTDANGLVTATFAAGSSAGTGRITAQSGAIMQTRTILVETPRAATLALVPSTDCVPFGGQIIVTTTVRDQFSAPLAGKLVSFAASLGGVQPSSGVTNSAGSVATTFTAGYVAGAANIDAVTGNVYGTTSFSVVNLPQACPTHVTHSIAPGLNLLGLNVEGETPLNAQAVLSEIAAQGGSTPTIYRWSNGGWDAYVAGLPFNNFTLELGKGYFIEAGSSSAWQRTGWPPTSPQPVPLYPGWNLIGLPKLAGPLYADDFLNGVAAQGGACSEIDRWSNGTWVGHIKGLPPENFVLSQTEGYFVKCTVQSIYTPGPTELAAGSPIAPPAVEPAQVEPEDGAAIYDVLVTNRRDVAFSVTWRTDRPSKGWVEYGVSDALDQVAREDRGAEVVSTIHHVTLSGLNPQTIYAFRVHSGDGVADQGGQPFTVTTAATTPPGVPLTAYGRAVTGDGTPATGALVRAWLANAAGSRAEPLSTLVDGWGYWTLSLPADGCSDRRIVLEAYGIDGSSAQSASPACDVQPAPALMLKIKAQTLIYLPLVMR